MLWVFGHDLDDGLYYRDTAEPLRVHNGRWSFLDKPIGATGMGDVGTTFTVAVVRDARSRKPVRRRAGFSSGDCERLLFRAPGWPAARG